MLQNPEAKKKEKYQLRPPFGADWSGAAIPDLAGETCMAGIGFELTVTPIIAKRITETQSWKPEMPLATRATSPNSPLKSRR